MTKSKKARLLKCIVCYCITLLSVLMIAVYIGNWYNIDNSYLLTAASSVFGGELLLTCILKLLDKDSPKKEDKNDEDNSSNG